MRPVVLLLAACSSGAPVASAAIDLNVQNWTTLMITIVVNGRPGVRVAPGVLATGFAALPALPWTVEAQTESGQTLATMFIGGAQDVVPAAAFLGAGHGPGAAGLTPAAGACAGMRQTTGR